MILCNVYRLKIYYFKVALFYRYIFIYLSITKYVFSVAFPMNRFKDSMFLIQYIMVRKENAVKGNLHKIYQ